MTTDVYPRENSIESIRPYLVAACKWYSEADTGPGAERGRHRRRLP